MKCSYCGDDNNFNITGWKKLVVQDLGIKSIPAVYYINCAKSEPYYILCPTCYKNLFMSTRPMIDQIITKTVEI
jgi:hypothetical protein